MGQTHEDMVLDTWEGEDHVSSRHSSLVVEVRMVEESFVDTLHLRNNHWVVLFYLEIALGSLEVNNHVVGVHGVRSHRSVHDQESVRGSVDYLDDALGS